jgi:hypothetical protein
MNPAPPVTNIISEFEIPTAKDDRGWEKKSNVITNPRAKTVWPFFKARVFYFLFSVISLPLPQGTCFVAHERKD